MSPKASRIKRTKWAPLISGSFEGEAAPLVISCYTTCRRNWSRDLWVKPVKPIRLFSTPLERCGKSYRAVLPQVHQTTSEPETFSTTISDTWTMVVIIKKEEDLPFRNSTTQNVLPTTIRNSSVHWLEEVVTVTMTATTDRFGVRVVARRVFATWKRNKIQVCQK